MSSRKVLQPGRYDPARHKAPCYPAARFHFEDNLSEAGAHKLATELTAWWHAQGYLTARHWIEPVYKVAKGGKAFAVRSNLVNGIPPRGRKDIPRAESGSHATRQEGDGVATPATPTPKAVSEAPATFLDGAAVGEWLRTREGG